MMKIRQFDSKGNNLERGVLGVVPIFFVPSHVRVQGIETVAFEALKH